MSKDKKKSIIDYYLEHDEKYLKIYGTKSIVLLESGHFMEIYDYIEDSRHLNICRDILGIMITRRDKSDDKSPFMAGIPTHSIRRYYKILLKNNYTVIIISQVTPPPDVKREVTKILSPGCNLSEDIFNNSDHGHSLLLSLLIQIDDDNEYFINLSSFDSNIGETKLQYIYNEESNSVQADNDNLLNNVREYLDKMNYNEILINIINEDSLSNNYDNLKLKIIDILNLKNKLYHFRFFAKKEISDYFKLSYQTQFLEKTFSHYKSLFCSIHENLNLDKEDPLLIINLVFLFNFISMHDKCLIINLNKPIIESQNNYNLKTFNETYSKLNIFDSSNNSNNSLFYLINFTSTSPGKRLLISNLKNPIYDQESLEHKYNMIEEILYDPNIIKLIEDNLKIIDLERIYRRFSIGKLNPYEIPRLGYSNKQIINLIELVTKYNFTSIIDIIPSNEIISSFKKYSEDIEFIFNFEKCSKTNFQNISDTLFNDNFNLEIDTLITKKKKLIDKLDKISLELSLFVETKDKNSLLTVKYNDKEGYWLDITKKRGNKLKDNINKSNNKQIIIEDLTLDLKSLEYNMQNKTNIKISSHQIKNISKNIVKLNEQIIEKTKIIYTSTVENLYQKYFTQTIIIINNFVSQIDLVKSSAKMSYIYKYCRPEIINHPDSCIDLKDLRHPIIERLLIEKGGKYVPNDIYLGPDRSNLLYGVNSVGKSSLLKSIALSIIMAQSGLFVPASKCQISLYTKIFSRTGNDDNLFLNHSSFVKEMTESKEIIQKADNKSLVIADELCASTESESALKIVTCIIKILSERKSSFIFATHMFKIMETNIIKEISTLKCKHLKVNFKQELIFDRKLSDGLPENKYYGLLVANKIIQNQEFSDLINTENNFKDLAFEIISTNKSNYNSKLYIDKCQICNYQNMSKNDIPLETHHINMQCEAINNYHGISHKNELHNLVILCKDCHSKVHNDEINIEGYIYSECGPKLKFNYNLSNDNTVELNKSKKVKKKKYDQDTINLIKKYYEANSYKTKLEIINYMNKTFNLNISYNIFNKIVNNQYLT